MKNISRRLSSTNGFTMIELIIVVTIIWVLTYTFQLGFSVIQAKVRFSKARADMDGIAQAAYNDYATNGEWGETAFGNLGEMPTSWKASGELKKWPEGPCPGWYYSWEDWATAPTPYMVRQVTLRRGNNTILWGYCVDAGSGAGANCSVIDPFNHGGSAIELSSLTDRHIYCSE